MKWKNYLYSLSICLLFVSCYNEDALKTSDEENIDRFEFPQGNNTWDEDIQDQADERAGVAGLSWRLSSR